jgi:2-dehydropantoate 2-reductase
MVGGGRGGKMPSFHIDLHSGKGYCEVDQLNGAVVRAGQEYCFPTPVNKTLNDVLTDLVVGNKDHKQYDRRAELLLTLVKKNELSDINR